MGEKKKIDPDEISVFTVPNGKAYHKSARCVTLRRSKVINEIKLANAGGLAPCGQCNPPQLAVKEFDGGDVKWEMTYFDKKWGIKLKSATIQDKGFKMLLEFTKDLTVEEIQEVELAVGKVKTKGNAVLISFYLFDEDNVYVGSALPDKIDGVVSGKKGEAFRVWATTAEATGKFKKVEARPLGDK